MQFGAPPIGSAHPTAAGRTALQEIGEKLARQDVAALETQGRFIKSRYGEERIDQ